MNKTNSLPTDSMANTGESPLTNSRTDKNLLSMWDGIINQFFGSEISIRLSDTSSAKSSRNPSFLRTNKELKNLIIKK